ncbi:hypothetical protein N7520_008605 [Penicillium odoratum]|uniref:uncharacterized protein n=1 Tax=Penicillium odoratum TaxID=1167516 RepID=UPI002549710C|nr:uncharacterized protein N7520_008605 [Penicillium odoratum]KAJ5751688.1 hypothetical protein N7520_008605 [Penicillium odoratum]
MQTSAETTLRYLQPLKKWEDTKPFQIVGRRPPGQPRDNLEHESHSVNIFDIRTVNIAPELNTTGFQWIKGPMSKCLGSQNEINDHMERIEIVLKDLLGAKGVFTFQYQFRKRGSNDGNPRIRPVESPALVITVKDRLNIPDITSNAIEERIRFSFPNEAEEILKGRYRMLR